MRDEPQTVVAVAQAFKESFGVEEVAEALEAGIAAAGARARVTRGSDGGDGLLDALAAELVRRTTLVVSGPLGVDVRAEAGWLDDATAVVESRLSCGLALLRKDQRDPLKTSTRGVGESIASLVAAGASEVLVGLGGSATMDGGVGMARAWGWTPVDASGVPLPEGGGSLERLERFVPGERPVVRLTGLADVTNALPGPDGARVFARQKGASPAAEDRLARGLERLAAIAAREGKGDLAALPGAGAAGGLGFGLCFFGGARLVRGARWMLERRKVPALLKGASLLIVTEGAFDETSLAGKLTGESLALARAAGVPAALVSPSIRAAPPGTLVETGGGRWTARDLTDRTRRAVERALRVPRGE